MKQGPNSVGFLAWRMRRKVGGHQLCGEREHGCNRGLSGQDCSSRRTAWRRQPNSERRSVALASYRRFLACAVLLISVPRGMADGTTPQSYATSSGIQPHTIFVEKYKDIKGCQTACDENERLCYELQQGVYGSPDAPGYRASAQACLKNWEGCRRSCHVYR